MLVLAIVLLAPRGEGAVHRVPQEHPTIQAAIRAASDGDTVLVSRGTYAGPFTLGKRLTVASAFLESGDPADLSGTILQGGSPTFTVTSSAGARILGFTFQGGDKALVLDRARQVEVRDCRFLASGGDQVSFESAGGTVRRCHFEKAGDDNIDIDGDSDPLIEDNALLDAADDNIEMRFQDRRTAVPLHTVIRRNHISGARSGDGIQLIDYPGASNRTVRIERNVIANCRWVGIGSLPDGRTRETDFKDAPHGSPQAERIYVIHNTIVGNAWGITGGRNMLLLNNIVADARGAGLRRILGTSVIRHTGLWNNGTDGDETCAPEGNLRKDPLLDANRRLRTGSPCIDAGLASTSWDGEIVSAGPFEGAAPDLGAFESGSGLPMVTVTAADATAAEPAETGAFTVSRSGPVGAALTVRYSTAGTATAGKDFAPLPGSVTIPAGAASATVTVTPRDDREAEAVETLTLTLEAGAGYGVGTPSTASLTITDDDAALPVLTLEATDPTASERDGERAVFTVTRTGSVAAALTVRYTIGGDAVNGVDYAVLSGRVVIPAGAAVATIVILPLDDRVVDEEEVSLTLTPSPDYALGIPAGATITIDDDDGGS